MRIVRRTTLVLGVALVATWGMTVPAGAAKLGKVGPKQYFTGVINGTDGNTSTPIPIQMACFGPLTPGETGHPMAGQTLAVHQLFPPASSGGTLGYTGNDSEIGFFLVAPPSSSTAAAPRAAKSVVFVRYDKTQRLSTALTLPCSGTGTVWFSPTPVVPPSRSASVPVAYESQP
jgi:hypothetical protein